VSKVWKLGMDTKDICDRVIVEKMVNDLMVEKREEFLKSTVEISRLARESVSEGGSSYSNLDRKSVSEGHQIHSATQLCIAAESTPWFAQTQTRCSRRLTTCYPMQTRP
jgi:hypothetical protein